MTYPLAILMVWCVLTSAAVIWLLRERRREALELKAHRYFWDQVSSWAVAQFSGTWEQRRERTKNIIRLLDLPLCGPAAKPAKVREELKKGPGAAAVEVMVRGARRMG